jgi:superfamily II DNA or RNA helicase
MLKVLLIFLKKEILKLKEMVSNGLNNSLRNKILDALKIQKIQIIINVTILIE